MTTTTPPGPRRDRLYAAYASQHAGSADGVASARIYRRDIRPLLPAPQSGPVMDIGCGQGELVRMLLDDGYAADGVDISPEQVAIAHASGINRVQQGNYLEVLASHREELAAVTAIDVLEHLTKDEVLETFDQVAAALVPSGVFVARVPNAVSPFGGYIRYGDFTHETCFTQRSVKQLASAVGFVSVRILACPPVAHGLASAARVVAWKSASALCKFTLAAETGVLRGHIVTQNLSFAARKPG